MSVRLAKSLIAKWAITLEKLENLSIITFQVTVVEKKGKVFAKEKIGAQARPCREFSTIIRDLAVSFA